MNNQKKDNPERALEILESGNNSKEFLNMSPKDKEEIQKTLFLIKSLREEKEKINPPRKILEKIFKEKEFSSQKTGRFSASEALYSFIINNLKIMNQKSKISIAILGIFALLIVGIIIFGSSKDNSEVANNPNQNEIKTTDQAIATTSAVTGDQEVDSSVNSVLNDVLSEDDLNEEMADIDLALSDEEDLNQINNLFNDDEL